MSEPYIGEIRAFPYKLIPRGWQKCDGATIQIVNNPQLFKVIGFTYGGNQSDTFAVPNFEPLRVAIGMGRGPGLTDRLIGSAGGEAQVTIEDETMPAHTHSLKADSGDATTNSFAGNYIAGNNQGFTNSAPNPDSTLSSTSLSPSGGGKPHNNIQPYLELNYLISNTGKFAPPNE